MPARIDFSMTFPGRDASSRRESGARARLLVMADLRGREGCGEPDESTLASRRTLVLDADGPDACLARLSPGLPMDFKGQAEGPLVELIRTMDDFHPDALFDRCSRFTAWREMRERLHDPSFVGGSSAPSGGNRGGASVSFGDLLLQASGEGNSDRPQGAAAGLDAFLRQVMAPHVVPAADPSIPGIIAALDEAISAEMRAALHDPRFQALESLWRALQRLAQRLETGESLEIRLLDATRTEAASDASLAQLLGDGPGWTLAVGGYRFGAAREDLEALERIASHAARARVPFLAAAELNLVGCASIETANEPRRWQALTGDAVDGWSRLRRSEAARWVALALPRFLLRLPYGAKTDPVERFAFEELPDPPEHESYLWGNPAFACAELILGARTGPAGTGRFELEDLPVHTYRAHGETTMKPCAEAFVSEGSALAIASAGIMPLVSVANRNAARFLGFHSISDPPTGLPIETA